MSRVAFNVYPGCTVDVTDWTAAQRNPLYRNPLVGIKDDVREDYPADAFDTEGFLTVPPVLTYDAHHYRAVTPLRVRRDVQACVRCDVCGYGPLCARHRREVTRP